MNQIQKISLIVWFYLGWFGCIYFSKWGISPWSFVFPIIPWSYFFITKIFTRRQIICLISFALIGCLFDLLAYNLNWIDFPNDDSNAIPSWLVAMWFLFVTVFPLSQELFKSKLILASILGCVFGPLSYYSGEAFEVMSFSNEYSIVIYALFWAAYFPLTIVLFKKMA